MIKYMLLSIFLLIGCDQKEQRRRDDLYHQNLAKIMAESYVYCAMSNRYHACFCFTFGTTAYPLTWAPDSVCVAAKIFEIEHHNEN